MGKEGEEASRVARGVEKIGILGRRSAGPAEPLLEEWGAGGEEEQRCPDREEKRLEKPNRGSERPRDGRSVDEAEGE